MYASRAKGARPTPNEQRPARQIQAKQPNMLKEMCQHTTEDVRLPTRSKISQMQADVGVMGQKKNHSCLDSCTALRMRTSKDACRDGGVYPLRSHGLGCNSAGRATTSFATSWVLRRLGDGTPAVIVHSLRGGRGGCRRCAGLSSPGAVEL